MRRPRSVPAVVGLLVLLLLNSVTLAQAPGQPGAPSPSASPALESPPADVPAPAPTEIPPTPSGSEPSRSLRLVIAQAPPDPVANAWYVGQERGFFKKHGLDIALVDCPTWDAATRAVATGHADGCVVGPHWPFFSSSPGFAARIVLVTHHAVGDSLIARKSIRSIKQLKKRRVGTRGGSSACAFLAETLRRNGMALKSIRFMPATTMEDVFEGWRARNYDAIVTWEPYLTRAIRRHRAVVLARSGNVSGIAPGFVVMTPDAIAARPAEVQKLVEAWYDIVDWIRAHPHEADAIVSRHAGLPVASYNFKRYGVRLMGRHENPSAFASRTHGRDYSSLWNLVPFRLRLDRQTSRSEKTRPPDIQVEPRFVTGSPASEPAPEAK